MSVKEHIVELVRAEGYDFMTACELATSVMRAALARGPGDWHYSIGTTTFTIRVGD